MQELHQLDGYYEQEGSGYLYKATLSELKLKFRAEAYFALTQNRANALLNGYAEPDNQTIKMTQKGLDYYIREVVINDKN